MLILPAAMYPRFSDIINDFFGTNINLPVQTYGFFVALAFALAGWIVWLELKRKEKEKVIFAFEKMIRKGGFDVKTMVHPRQLTANIILVAAISGIIGAKLFDVAEHLDRLIDDPLGVLFSFDGLTFYGGLITAAFAVGIYAERNRIPWPVIADVVAPALMLAYGIGRIGCQLSGDGCWGLVNPDPRPEWLSWLPGWMWAFDYPNNVINAGVPIPGCHGSHCHVLGQPVYPTPFYETMMALVLFTVLWFVRKRIRTHGYLFSIYLILNGMERLLIEQLRVNIKYNFLGIKVTQAEIIAVGLIVAGIAGFFYFRWRLRKYPQRNSV